eukprot:2728247-Prorocentrum_lima.AAC.1
MAAVCRGGGRRATQPPRKQRVQHNCPLWFGRLSASLMDDADKTVPMRLGGSAIAPPTGQWPTC